MLSAKMRSSTRRTTRSFASWSNFLGIFQIFPSTQTEQNLGHFKNVLESFIHAGKRHGYPQSTLTDNGRAFTTNCDRTKPTRNGFEQLLVDLAIIQKNGKPYHPQTQGKVERFHHTLKVALANKATAKSIEELNEQLTEIIEYYNYKRPHRALHRCTPAEAYNALPKARPASIKRTHEFRLRADKVGKNGKTTLRWRGKLRRLYIGRRWTGQPITMTCKDEHVTIKIATTGEQIAAYTMEADKVYYNQKDVAYCFTLPLS